MPPFFRHLRSSITHCFRGYFLLWQLLAIVSTALLVLSGFDWWYFTFFRKTLVQQILFPAVGFGFLIPIILPFALWALGLLQKNIRTLTASGAVGQAAAFGLFLSSTYKAFTGRVPPVSFQDTATLVDTSHQFQFGFLRGGVFWGWPSSHTTVAFAVAVTLYVLYPDKKVVRYTALLYALYIGLGISMSIHWFSDFVAGAIFGSIIGVNVGRNFLNKNQSSTTNVHNNRAQ